ncbi:hypothetical protein KFL_008860030 [Klebsormidium nitens]|uniref:FAS1 domain-containing protein n=1 Tax=Klebsormidium nitens TaxID=105231 RepID=A0A1Y1ITF7_KLENI|nr:hypothetical protein KFL_008860030 [Klebsormidium nitens]|eukprot:GAQ91937.1 hypothetical protein KFL_008860030 [Klebsormidium nitens]
MARSLPLVCVALTLSLLAAVPCSAQTNLTQTLLSLQTDSTYSTVATAIVAANLTEPIVSLSDSSGVTLLAPNNEAFNALGNATVSCLLAQPGLVLLSTVLRYHVIAGFYNSTAIVAAAPVSLPSVLGPDLNITVSGSTVQVNTVPVVAPDVIQAIPSAVVHGISSVLIPPGGLQAVQAYCASAPTTPTPVGASSGLLSGFNGLFALAMFAVCALQVLL